MNNTSEETISSEQKVLEKLKIKLALTRRENADLLCRLNHLKNNIIEAFHNDINDISEPRYIKSGSLIKDIYRYFVYLKHRKSFESKVRAYLKLDEDMQANRYKKYNFKSLTEMDRNLIIGDKYIRVYYLALLPNYVCSTSLFRLINLPIPMALSYHIKGTNKGAMIKAARQRLSVLESIQNSRLKKGKSIDPEIKREMEEVDVFINNLVNDYEKCFLSGIYVAVFADSLKGLLAYDRKFQDETQDIEFTFNPYTFAQEKAYGNILPCCIDNVEENQMLQTSALVNILPFLTRNLNDPSGIFFGVNHYNSSLILIDIFKARNANLNIFGTSGSGKSVTAKLIMTRLMLRGVQNIIIDPEGEYVGLTRRLGGEVIGFSQKSGIDPFALDLEKIEDIKDYIQVLKQFFCFFIQPGHIDTAKLDKLLIKTYLSKGRPSFNKFVDILKNSAKKDAEILFLDDILQLTLGSLGGIFNSKGNMNLNADIVCFDLSKLNTDEKKIPAIYLLGNMIKKLICKADRQRMIYIDEAHKLLINNATVNFYIDLVKTARKRRTGVVSITQNPEDFKDSNNARTIITQAETTILLKQASASVHYIRQNNLFQLTEREALDLTLFAVGEALFIREREHININIFPFESEKALIFT